MTKVRIKESLYILETSKNIYSVIFTGTRRGVGRGSFLGGRGIVSINLYTYYNYYNY